MSEKEKAAKEVGKKAKKLAGNETGFGAEHISPEASYQGAYGVDYFTGTKAQEHARDTSIKAKALADIRSIYDQSGEKNLQAHLTVTDQDVAAYKSFLNLEYLRDFDYYTGNKFLKGANPAQIKWIHEIYPDLFQRRVDELDKILDVQKKVAMINIMGPRSKDDLLFMYELNLWKTKDFTKYDAIVNKSVALGTGVTKVPTRGILNVADMFKTAPNAEERAASAGAYAQFNAGGDKTSRGGNYTY